MKDDENQPAAFWKSLATGDITISQLSSMLQTAADKRNFETHPLGFIRLRLLSQVDSPLYLHVWDHRYSHVQSAEMTVHSHSVDVFSYVLCGEVLDTSFTWEKDVEGSMKLYKQNRSGSGPTLVSLYETGNAFYLQSKTHKASGSYSIPYPLLHRTDTPSESLTATIAMFSGASSNDPIVVVPRHIKTVPEYSSHYLNNGETVDIVNQVLFSASV